jgi:hypothetical protein
LRRKTIFLQQTHYQSLSQTFSCFAKLFSYSTFISVFVLILLLFQSLFYLIHLLNSESINGRIETRQE